MLLNNNKITFTYTDNKGKLFPAAHDYSSRETEVVTLFTFLPAGRKACTLTVSRLIPMNRNCPAPTPGNTPSRQAGSFAEMIHNPLLRLAPP